MLDNLFDMRFDFLVQVLRVLVGLVAQVLDDRHDFGEHFRPSFLYVAHEILDLFGVGPADYHFVALIHKHVNVICEPRMFQESVIYFDETVELILRLLILPQILGDIFIGLNIFIFEPIKPFLCLFDVDLFHVDWRKTGYNIDEF